MEFPADDLERARRFWQGVLGTSMPTFDVPDLAAALERVVALGGEVVDRGETSAVCRDSEGSAFGLRAASAGPPRGSVLASHDAATWGDHLADVYEDWLSTTGVETDAAVDLLAELARGGPVLELAIGTGRIALPLAERGLHVEGVDGSERMVAKLRARPGGDRIPVAIGDFADVPVDGRFELIFVVFNTLFALTTQDAQVRCFANVAEHLTDDGLFVIEVQVPPIQRFRGDNFVDIYRVDRDRIMLGFEIADPVTQASEQMEVWITEDGIRMFPNPSRYAWPAELDLMARLAGLELRDRWAGWRRETFTGKSPGHVSVYGRAGG